MFISKKSWSRVSDNFGSIVLLSLFYIFIMTEFPGYFFLGATVNIIARLIIFILGMIAQIWLFTANDIEKGLAFYCVADLDKPLRTRIRVFSTIFGALAFIAMIYHFAYKGLNYSKSYCIYGVLYIGFLHYFLYRAVEKRKCEKQVD